MKQIWKFAVLGLALVISAYTLARAYTYKYRAQNTIVVTGLGETEFSSDLIVWTGNITAESQNVEAGYRQIEQSKQKVQRYLEQKGIPRRPSYSSSSTSTSSTRPTTRPTATGPDSASRATN